ncbi:MAG TPA: methionine--tRNA ligase [Vicinamibacterales bacterium]|jgi:methionyl-tRNA synthetase
MSRFYITTAIDYVNSRPHLGTAYEKITADVIARYKRLCGIPTHFLMGNDEYSQNVFRRARELGLEPLAYCDHMEQVFRDVWSRLDISYDDFIRTTQPRHRAAVTSLVERVRERGDIYEGFYEGWYCESCEAFKQEKDLEDGLCAVHGKKPEWIKEKNYFFRLSKYQQPLLAFYREHPSFLEPDIRRNEIVRLIEGGLEDISISRAGQLWGIPMPFDNQSVVYVWFDALTNYISAVGYGLDEARFQKWWPVDVHIVGKDITRFHGVIWPGMLLSAGLPLPRQVFGHGWVHFKGQKMSKSLGNVVDPLDAVDKFGPDPLRLYLVKEITYGQDGDFSWERFQERYNVDLANNLGNLVSRVAAMVDRYQQGQLTPTASAAEPIQDVTMRSIADYVAAMDRYALHEGAAAVYRIVDATNEYIAATEPWTLARDQANRSRLNDVLYRAAEAVRIVGVLLLPIMPKSASEILFRMGEWRDPSSLTLANATEWVTDRDRRIVKSHALWPRLEESADVAAKERKSGAMTNESSKPADARPAEPPVAAQPPPAPADTRLSIDEFLKVELRTAKVLGAERVPNSKKLVKLDVDLGVERRTIVAGIAEAYEPDALVGKTIVIVANLRPAKLMGIESNGMLLAASADGGKPMLLHVDGDAAPGTRVR